MLSFPLKSSSSFKSVFMKFSSLYSSISSGISSISPKSILFWTSLTNSRAKAAFVPKSKSLRSIILNTIFLHSKNSERTSASMPSSKHSLFSLALKLKVVFSAFLKIILAASGHDKDSPTSFKSKNSSVYLGNCWQV